MNAYLSFLADKHSHCQNILSTAMVFAQGTLRNYHEDKRSGRTTDKGMPEIPINSFATTLLIPAFVNRNHWVLCVAKRDEANRFLGSIEWYNSMSTSDAGALDVVKSVEMVLE